MISKINLVIRKEKIIFRDVNISIPVTYDPSAFRMKFWFMQNISVSSPMDESHSGSPEKKTRGILDVFHCNVHVFLEDMIP